MPLIYLLLGLSVILNSAGWLLSMLHHVDAAGYLIVGALVVVSLAFQWKKITPLLPTPSCLASRFGWRFRHAIPLAFLCSTVLLIVSAVLFEPNSIDTLSYRIPRILHWIDAGRWHWIESTDCRVNTHLPALEWTALPILLFTGSNQALVVTGILHFLCLPGLFFGTLRLLGVARRAAWYWMWLLPLAYGFLLQAGSFSSDLPVAVYGLAALYFAMRGNRTRQWSDYAWSLLAAALMSGTKQSALPLLLPWAVAITPGWTVACKHLWKSFAVGLLALSISGAWILGNNWYRTGDWTGVSAEGNINYQNSHSALNLVGTALQFSMQNFLPPAIPGYDRLNTLVERWKQTDLGRLLNNNFQEGYPTFFKRMTPDFCGLGFLFSLLLLLSVLYGWHYRSQPSRLTSHQKWIGAAVIFIWIISFSKFSARTPSRLFLPFDLYAIPFLLIGGAQATLVTRQWWKVLALLCAWSAPVCQILIFEKSPALAFAQPIHFRYWEIYNTDLNSWLIQQLPPGTRTIGVVQNWWRPRTWLWQPYGSRRIIDLKPNKPAPPAIDTFVLNAQSFGNEAAAEAWISTNNAQLVSRYSHPLHGTWILAIRRPE